ncbi:hypothetical protein Hanom_Chr06g00535751 [Helianthus anomalus]
MDVDCCEAEAGGGNTSDVGDDPEDGAKPDVAGQKGNDSVSLETVGSLMQNIDPSVIVGNLKESINEEVFISGDKFDFDKVDVHEVLEVSLCNVNKCKKKQACLGGGQPSPSYSSSLEKNKLGKKPKGDDPFGLDELLGLNEEGKYSNPGNCFKTPCHLTSRGCPAKDKEELSVGIQIQEVYDGSAEGTSDNLIEEHALGTEEEEGQSSVRKGFPLSPGIDDFNVESAIEAEAQATIVVGVKLGAQVEVCKDFIKENIAKEDVQAGLE